MKKKILALLSIMVLSSTLVFAASNKYTTSGLSKAMQMYKAHNYSECYVYLKEYVSKDPSNALAYYYLAMSSAQIGNIDDARTNYDKAISLANPNGKIVKYATLGKACLDSEEACSIEKLLPETEKFVNSGSNQTFSDEAKSEFERLKIENLMREMNRSQDITPQRFKEFKDFSGMNTVPTNEEIVAAIRTLQNAGMSPFGANSMDISLLMNSNLGTQNTLYNQLSNTSLNPQIIQALMTNNLQLGF